MTPMICPHALVEETLSHLRIAGGEGCECVVLWLSRRPAHIHRSIEQTYRPQQQAARDIFRIPPASMSELMAHLRTHKLALAAQVHSHPGRAFHSHADDKWAIVRHVGALSIVVPRFAVGIDAASFLEHAVAYRLSETDEWVEVPRAELPTALEVTP